MFLDSSTCSPPSLLFNFTEASETEHEVMFGGDGVDRAGSVVKHSQTQTWPIKNITFLGCLLCVWGHYPAALCAPKNKYQQFKRIVIVSFLIKYVGVEPKQ